MVLEEVDQVFRPFAQGYLPGVEDRVGEGVEPPSAGRGKALVRLHAVAPLAELPNPWASAVRAPEYGDRVYESGFEGTGLRVLLQVPPHRVGLDEKARRAAQKDVADIDFALFHFSPFPRVRRRAPGSGETSDGIRLRTCSKAASLGGTAIIQ